jgi:hypothetical protein
MKSSVPIKNLRVSVFTVPTDAAEADGTFWWNKTTMVLVEVTAGNQIGIGYTYADEAVARLIHKSFANLLQNKDALAIGEIWSAML